MIRSKYIKALVIGSILLIVGLFWLYDGAQYLTLDFVKDVQLQVDKLYDANRFSILFLFGFGYMVMAALSLPGAGIMTVAAGAFFGLVDGTVIVSISSTLGASLAFLITRSFFQDFVQSRFGDKFIVINDGIEREGGFYLFTLRLIPIFPFFIINLVMGLTTMKLRTFFIASQLGMLAPTIVFVNAGRELAKIDSLAGILSPSLIASFAMIGLLPITAKKSVEWWRRKRSEQRE